MGRLEGNEWLTHEKLEVYFTIQVRKYEALNEDARRKIRLMKTFLEGNSSVSDEMLRQREEENVFTCKSTD